MMAIMISLASRLCFLFGLIKQFTGSHHKQSRMSCMQHLCDLRPSFCPLERGNKYELNENFTGGMEQHLYFFVQVEKQKKKVHMRSSHVDQTLGTQSPDLLSYYLYIYQDQCICNPLSKHTRLILYPHILVIFILVINWFKIP